MQPQLETVDESLSTILGKDGHRGTETLCVFDETLSVVEEVRGCLLYSVRCYTDSTSSRGEKCRSN